MTAHLVGILFGPWHRIEKRSLFGHYPHTDVQDNEILSSKISQLKKVGVRTQGQLSYSTFGAVRVKGLAQGC